MEIKLPISLSVKINSIIVEDWITGHNFLSHLSLTLLCDLHFLSPKVVHTSLCLDCGLSHVTFFGWWDISRCDTSSGLKCACSLILHPFPWGKKKKKLGYWTQRIRTHKNDPLDPTNKLEPNLPEPFLD